MEKNNSHSAKHLFFIAKKPRPLLGCEAPTTTPERHPGDGTLLPSFLWPNYYEASMYLDRELQLAILKELREVYPRRTAVRNLTPFENTAQFKGNLSYLKQHELVTRSISTRLIGKNKSRRVHTAAITAKGLDFLEGDGGISAVLGKVVVKFDTDDLATIMQVVEQSKGTDEEKAQFKTILKSLPEDGLKTVYTRLLNLAVDNLPTALRSIEKLF